MSPARRRGTGARRKPRKSGSAPAGSQQTFKIGEAARRVGVAAYVLRFWETQFPILRLDHARSTHRVYAPADIDKLRLIKRLLHQERFTIAGARKHLKQVGLERLLKGGPGSQPRPAPPAAAPGRVKQTLAEIRKELESIHTMLED